jgi:hypothetical protein
MEHMYKKKFHTFSLAQKKNKKQKRCSAALAGVVVLPDIAVTCCEVQRVASHRNNVATSNMLVQRHKNVASCSALSANVATTLRAATLPTIATALRGAIV